MNGGTLEVTVANPAPHLTPGGHWGAGLGFASVDVPDARGALQGGGRFDITTEVDTEIVASLLGGVRRRIGQRWLLDFALRADQHFATWESTDRVSGRTGTVDDYLARGGAGAELPVLKEGSGADDRI